MLVVTKSRGFNFSTGTLVRDAQRLLGALQDDVVGSPVMKHLSPAFVADFAAQITLVAKRDTEQATAVGAVSSLTGAQEKALTDFTLLARMARRIARFSLPGQVTILRTEFQVGVHRPTGIPAVLARGRKLLTACQTYATELAAQGWSSGNTDSLGNALETLTGIDRNQEVSKDEKQGSTSERNAAANRLYQQCAVVQGAARVVYAGATAPLAPEVVEARARFLFGEFPPRRNTATGAVPSEPALPVVATLEPAVTG